MNSCLPASAIISAVITDAVILTVFLFVTVVDGVLTALYFVYYGEDASFCQQTFSFVFCYGLIVSYISVRILFHYIKHTFEKAMCPSQFGLLYVR